MFRKYMRNSFDYKNSRNLPKKYTNGILRAPTPMAKENTESSAPTKQVQLNSAEKKSQVSVSININTTTEAQKASKYRNNKISTCKYRWWNFIFIFLFEQYQKVFNIFTLVVMICNSLDFANVVSNSTLIMPIVFVLALAAIRELIEDIGRARSDQYSNNLKYQIIRGGEKMEVKSQNIVQGDLLLLQDGQEVPCDVVLLNSSE